ncbi:unnamed protein product [Allacma fusca]|uniref:ARID domain-containing protein n=1 Tax=Allacma fusca TaxID=39272 RepID=A0A8J2LH30_9HEXA|nr:unnamed protein product [Allacma fusca]
MGDDPPYLMVGTEVSAKYKGAFCEAKIRKVVRVVKCRVTFKAGLGSATLSDDQVKGDLRVGAIVEAKHPDKTQFVEATINKIQDSSQYTVVFDDGDITTLRRSALCLKSGRHFNESETLDQLPLTHPEHFSNPVMGGRRGVRRRAANNDDNENESSEDEDIPAKKGRKKINKEADMGKVVCVESTDKKKIKDAWFPALIVSPSAQETVKIRTKDEYLVRSFKDGRYYTVPKKETTDFTKDSSSKSEHSSNKVSTAACEKAVQYLEKNELPPHWDRDVLFGHLNADNSDDALSESEMSEDDPREDKDRFVAQLYKFMDERGTPINKVPTVCSKDLDLYKLYKIVTSKGGYNKVTNSSQWKPVTIKMGYGTVPTTSTINLVKHAYKKFLHNFEEFYRKLGCPLNSISSSSSSVGKSRSNRSIFRERHSASAAKETKKEEPKVDRDEEEKKSAASSSSSSSAASPEEVEADTDSVMSEETKKADSVSERPEEARRSRSRLDSRSNKKDSEDASEKLNEKSVKGKRASKKREPSEQKEREKEREESRTPVSASPSPAPPSSTTGKRGRGKYKKKESQADDVEIKSEPEESPDHIGKHVKIQIGDKLQVYYGPKSKGNVTYEAKVVEIDELEQRYLVHYTGWNTRYDEWIERFRISSLSSQKDQLKGGNEAPPELENTMGPGSKSGLPNKTPKRKGRPASTGAQNQNSKMKTVGARKRQTSESERGRKRRTRQKSGQDSFTQSGSGSDADSSDSEDKQLSMISTPSSVSSTCSARASKGRKLRGNEDDDASSASSSTSGSLQGKSTKNQESQEVESDISSVQNATSTNQPAEKQNQVIDLNQIRSEMKGLDKMVKVCPSPPIVQGAGSSAATSVSVPAVSVCLPQSEIKLDVYEFQEDANDAPKLKMFAPRSPDKKDDTIKITSESAEKNLLAKVPAVVTDLVSTTPEQVTSASVQTLTASSSSQAETSVKPPVSVSREEGNKAPKEQKKKKDSKDSPRINDEPTVTPATKSKSVSAMGNLSEASSKTVVPVNTTVISGTTCHSSGAASLSPVKTATTINLPVLHSSTAVETKSTLRMLTPILHTPQQPNRQRAILTSFPPPLIPSGGSKPPSAVQIHPRPSTLSPPMPSLTQRPPISPTGNSFGLPLASPQLQPQVQQLRAVTPVTHPTIEVSGTSVAPTVPILQPAAVIKSGESKPNTFASRQQELFPHLVQQAKTTVLPKVAVTIGSSSGVIAPLNNPITVIAPNRLPIVPPIHQSTTAIEKEPLIQQVTPALGIHNPLSSQAVPKKSLMKRKQPSKDKTPTPNPPAAVTSLNTTPGSSTSRMDTLPPKKKARKVITKNIMDHHQRGDPEKAEPVVKKPRKSNKKRLQLETEATQVLLPDEHKPFCKSPVKSFKKKTKTDPAVPRPAPAVTPKGIPSVPIPPQTYSTSVQSAPALVSHSAASFSVNLQEPVSSMSDMPSFSGVTKPLTTYAKTVDLLSSTAGQATKTDTKSTPLAKSTGLQGAFGVLKTPDKKSYSSKMSAVQVAHIASCIDTVAKLPPDSVSSFYDASSSKPVSSTYAATSLKPAPATTTFVKIPGKFESTPIVITTMTTGQTATAKPLSVIPTVGATLVKTTAATPSAVTGPGSFTGPLLLGTAAGIGGAVLTKAPPIVPISSPLVFTTALGSIVTPQINSKQVLLSTATPKDILKVDTTPTVLTYPPAVAEIKTEPNEDKPKISDVASFTQKENSEVRSKGEDDGAKIAKEEIKEETWKTLVPQSSLPIPDNLGAKLTIEIKDENTTTKEEDESCNSLLCEEIIPGSPPPGADSSLFGIEDENARIHSPTNSTFLPKEQSKNVDSSSMNSVASTSKNAYSSTFGQTKLTLKGSNDKSAEGSFPTKSPSSSEISFKTKCRDGDSDLGDCFQGRSKSPPSQNYRSSEGQSSKSRETGKSANANSLQERPVVNHGNNHPQVPLQYNNSQQQNLQHVIDNTPPTTPESSSISSGSPRVEGGRVSPTHDPPSSSSKSKDSSDLDSNDQKLAEITEEGSSSDAGRKYVKEPLMSPQKKRQSESARNSRNASPPTKRRRVQRRMKSPDEIIRSFSYRGRGSGGRKGNSDKDTDHSRILPPPPPINLIKPPISKKYNLIPDLEDGMESEIRIQVLQQALQSIKEKYQEVKSELSSEERRLKRYKRRLKEREKERSRLSQKST